MQTRVKYLRTILSVLAVALLLALSANAQCGNLDQFNSGGLRPQSWLADGQSPTLLRIHDDDSDRSIVGLWKFEMRTKNSPGLPDDFLVDHGFTQWHSDGTEIMNSSRPPVTGSFCLGTWKRVGGVYKLNHFALSWNPNNTFLGIANIREDVSVSDDGKSFSGHFSLTQYDEAGTAIFHAEGNITGKRITIHTDVSDVL